MSFNAETAIKVVPALTLAASGWALAWVTTGSIDSADWLPYALLAALLLAVTLLAGGSLRPTRRETVGVALLLGLAVWAAISASWSAVPALGRDEALLTAFYAIVLLVPLTTLATPAQRLVACAGVAAAASLLAVGAALELRFGANQVDHFYSGRLSFPISYPNALAAALLIGFWPAVVLASQRPLHPLARAASL